MKHFHLKHVHTRSETMAQVQFSVYRYNPDVDNAPRMQDYTLQIDDGHDMMVLDALLLLKEQDPSLSFMP